MRERTGVIDRRQLRRAPGTAWLVLAAMALPGITGCAVQLHATAVAPVPFRLKVGHFESEGRRIRVDEYRPEGDGQHPAVIVVHGSSGVHRVFSDTATRYAEALAEQGLLAFVVHYFDSTGNIMAGMSEERIHYFTWVRVLEDAVTWVRTRPEVDADRVGVLGHSLGGFLAVGAGAFDPRISRVVLFGGGLEPFLARMITRMPPTLVCHGDADGEVSLAEARNLVAFLRARNCEVELRVYPGEGHALSGSAIGDALGSAGRFLSGEGSFRP
jgi:carboxymethylenebutenolidase